jgi:hypothetical protein
MSLIHTAELNGVPSFPYLLAMLKNPEGVKANPGAWMPWNYQQQGESPGQTHVQIMIPKAVICVFC